MDTIHILAAASVFAAGTPIVYWLLDSLRYRILVRRRLQTVGQLRSTR